MKDSISKKSAEILDILEQIESVNKMIDLHLDDDFMQEQYGYRKRELTQTLVKKLEECESRVEIANRVNANFNAVLSARGLIPSLIKRAT